MDSQRWSRLLFEQALEIEPAKREGWMVSVCAGDGILLEELRQMLAADMQAESDAYLERAPVPVSTNVLPLVHDGDVADRVPHSRQFGPYRLLRLIGEGGMGQVYLAERADGAFAQRVALKLLPLPTPGLSRRFRQERQILAHLEHPHIARLLDGGMGEAGVPYFAMEYVDGLPITRYAKENAVDVKPLLMLFLRVCAAVHYAHRNLVVHRDLKPSNILVTADGTSKLLDFGIAKILQTTGDSDVTQTAMRAFTPDYAAPEQIRGEAITTASDVYALGVVLYELLTGVRPYKLDSRQQSLDHAILHTSPTSPSAMIVKMGEPDAKRSRLLRGDLDRIVLKSLAKEPERRYSSAEALAADIQRYLDGAPIAAHADSIGYRMRKFVGRNRVAVTAAAIVVIALIAATAISLGQAQRANTQARRAKAEAKSAQAAQDFMLDAFVHAEPWRNGGRPPNALELAESAMQRIDTQLSDEPLAMANMYRALVRLFTVAGDVRLSTVAARKEIAVLERMPSADSRTLVDARTMLAYSLMYNSDLDGAENEFRTLSANRPQQMDKDIAVDELGAVIARDRGRLSDYLRRQRAVTQRTIALFGENSHNTADDYWHTYEALTMLGDFGHAEEALEHDHQILEHVQTTTTPSRLSLPISLLALAAERDAAVAAIVPARRTVERIRAVFGRSSNLSDALMTFGRIERLAGQTEAALVSLAEAQNIVSDPAHGSVLDRAQCDKEIGWAHLDAGRIKDADTALRRALIAYTNIGGDEDPRGLAVGAALAHIAWLRREPQALEQLRTSARLARVQPLAEAPEILEWMAEAANDSGQSAEAEAAWKQALDILEQQGRPLSPASLRIHRSLALFFVAAKRSDEATQQAQTALEQRMALFGEDDVDTDAVMHRAIAPLTIASDTRAATRERVAKLARPGIRLIEMAQHDLDGTEGVFQGTPATSAPAGHDSEPEKQ